MGDRFSAKRCAATVFTFLRARSTIMLVELSSPDVGSSKASKVGSATSSIPMLTRFLPAAA